MFTITVPDTGSCGTGDIRRLFNTESFSIRAVSSEEDDEVLRVAAGLTAYSGASFTFANQMRLVG